MEKLWSEAMSTNLGKKFEKAFRDSCPDTVLVYRPPDAAQSFNKNQGDGTRFSRHSPCDFLVFDCNRGVLFAFELKTFDGSCSFERTSEDKGTIHYYQIRSLKEFATHPRVYSGLVLDFRKYDHTYYLPIREWDNLVDSITKKSFTEGDMLTYSHPILIEKKRKKVHYKYNIDKLLEDIVHDDSMSHESTPESGLEEGKG